MEVGIPDDPHCVWKMTKSESQQNEQSGWELGNRKWVGRAGRREHRVGHMGSVSFVDLFHSPVMVLSSIITQGALGNQGERAVNILIRKSI